MPYVVITGWRIGLRKINVTRILQARAGLGLAAAKALTDRVLDGETVVVPLPSKSSRGDP